MKTYNEQEEPESHFDILFRLKGRTNHRFTQLVRLKYENREIKSHECKIIESLSKTKRGAKLQSEVKSLGKKLF